MMLQIRENEVKKKKHRRRFLNSNFLGPWP